MNVSADITDSYFIQRFVYSEPCEIEELFPEAPIQLGNHLEIALNYSFNAVPSLLSEIPDLVAIRVVCQKYLNNQDFFPSGPMKYIGTPITEKEKLSPSLLDSMKRMSTEVAVHTEVDEFLPVPCGCQVINSKGEIVLVNDKILGSFRVPRLELISVITSAEVSKGPLPPRPSMPRLLSGGLYGLGAGISQ